VTVLDPSTITLGSSATDTATLSGGVNPTGSIFFNAYGPSDTAVCTGTPAFTDTVTDVNGKGDYTSGAFTPLAAGRYWWIASCSGDGNNKPASDTCGDELLLVDPPSGLGGAIIVKKIAIGGDGTFSFTGSSTPSTDGLDVSFSIVTSSGSGTKTFTGIDTGNAYAVTEGALPFGWNFISAGCIDQGGSPVGTSSGTGVSGVTVSSGGTVTCTFTDEKSAAPPSPPDAPVGGELYSVDKSALVQPYVGLLGLLGAVAAVFAVRRRREV